VEENRRRIFNLIGHIDMPLRPILYFVIPSRASNLLNLNRQEQQGFLARLGMTISPVMGLFKPKPL
jgi:hypothetical protein